MRFSVRVSRHRAALAGCALALLAPGMARAANQPCDYGQFVLTLPPGKIDQRADQPQPLPPPPAPGSPQADPVVHAAIRAEVARQIREDPAMLCRYRAADLSVHAASVVFMGDSHTEFWPDGDPALFGKTVIGRGIVGQTMAQMLLRFRQDVINLHPRAVHILAGTNDLGAVPADVQAAKDNLHTMVDLARAHHIAVIIGTLPPPNTIGDHPADIVARTDAFNAWLKTLAAQEHLALADYSQVLRKDDGTYHLELSMDGTHPNRTGYAAMRPILTEALHAAGVTLP